MSDWYGVRDAACPLSTSLKLEVKLEVSSERTVRAELPQLVQRLVLPVLSREEDCC